MSKYISLIVVIAFLVLCAVVGYQKYRITALEKELEIAEQNAALYLQTANNNADVLDRMRGDFNASLVACFADYADLNARFNDYRNVIVKSAANANATVKPSLVIPASTLVIPAKAGIQSPAQHISCEITAPTPISRALNDLR
jgi:hypothetical protein